MTVSGLTDSVVATHALGRVLTTSHPLCIVAMEVAIQMERLGLDLRLAWTPRHLNEEADYLSNCKIAGSLTVVFLGTVDKDARC